ncbi:MAG: Phage virulence-associated protein [Sphingomonadales bacterium]|nr:Phage virulence-associated protein [Sphingomonadales bacterium]
MVAVADTPVKGALLVGPSAVQHSELADVPVATGKRASIVGDPVPWEWQSGDFSARATADTLHGLYRPSRTVAVASGCWVRLWDGISGKPEWFGAVPNIPAFDNLPAIMACLKHCGTVLLQAGTYYHSGTIKLTETNMRIVGASNWFASQVGEASCSRICGTDPGVPVIQFGPDAKPSHINDFPAGLALEDIWIQRNVAPSTLKHNGIVKIGYCRSSWADRICAENGIYGFHFSGSVEFRYGNIYAARSMEGTGSGEDKFYGIYVDGNEDIGAAGGNASLRGGKIAITGTALVPDSRGLVVDKYFTDCWLDEVETVSCPIGIDIQGDGSGTIARAVAGNTDFKIGHAVLDGYTTVGARIRDVNKYGSVEILYLYAAPTGSGERTAALQIQDCPGRVDVRGGQVPMFFGEGCNAIVISNSDGWTVDGIKILECSGVGFSATRASGGICKPQFTNHERVMTAAVSLVTQCVGNVIEPMIKGDSNKVLLGIAALDATSSLNEFRMTGVRSSCIKGGAANKLVVMGKPITAAGRFGTDNVVSGVMA